MEKKLILNAAVIVMCLAALTGCGTKLTANPLALEAGDPVPDDILEYVTISGGDSEEVLANAVLSAEDIDNLSVGQYTATVTYGRQTVEINVEVVDTTSPALEETKEVFTAGDTITVDDLVTIEDFSGVTGVFIDEDGNESDTVTAEEGMTVTVRVTDDYDNFTELKLSPDVSDTTTDLYGTWAASFNLSDAIESELGSDFAGFHEEFDIILMIDFNEDGTFKMYTDESALTDTFQTYVESLASFGAEMIYDELISSGYSRKEINSIFKNEYGMDVETYMLKELQESVNIGDLVADIETTGVFEAKGNKLYMDEFAVSSFVYDLFTIDGDVLTIEAAGDVDSTEIMEGFDYPYIFNRVQ